MCTFSPSSAELDPLRTLGKRFSFQPPVTGWSDGQEGWVASGTVEREESLLIMLWDAMRMLWV